jgi:acyl-[acyl carrier protein]--UDP-N-acetylglucosamine O-acyltransferase
MSNDKPLVSFDYAIKYLLKDKGDYDIIKKDFENNLFDFAVIAVSTSISFRKKIFTDLTNIGIPFGNLIHPTAYIGFDCIIGTGNIILPFVSVGPCTEIGNNNFISAHSNIEHHNCLGSHCTFGPGVMMSGTVTIEDQVKFGTGVFVEPRLSIGHNSIISSCSIITKTVPSNTIVFSKQNELSFKTLNK